MMIKTTCSKKLLTHTLTILLVSFGVFSIVATGGGSNDSTQPDITLKVTDCDKDNIEITVDSKVSPASGSYSVSTTVTVTCDGKPVNGAEFKISYWWGKEFKLTTDKDGKKTHKQKKSSSSGYKGQKVKITIKDMDGDEKQVEVVVK